MSVRRWLPPGMLARRIARLLLVAHAEGVIKLGGYSEIQLKEWQWQNLSIGPRKKLGSLWRIHGTAILAHRQGKPMAVEIAPEQLQDLQTVLSEAS